MTYLSDIISTETMQSWQQGCIVPIIAGTGSGKSYFIRNKFAFYFKDNQILFLTNRKSDFNQKKGYIRNSSNIELATYQMLEQPDMSTECFDVIVCDEAHYFLSDSVFNGNTDISYNKIFTGNNMVVCLSATSGKLLSFLHKHENNYTICPEITMPSDYNYIQNAYYYYNKNTVFQLMEKAIMDDRKWMFFVESAKIAYDLYLRSNDEALFYVSDSNSTYSRYNDRQAIDRMLENEKFDKRILVATKVMENGVNICDKDVQNIVIDSCDLDTLIQFIGRKRLSSSGDSLTNLYVHRYHPNELQSMANKEIEKLKHVDDYYSLGENRYGTIHRRDPDPAKIVQIDYSDGLFFSINKLREYYCRSRIEQLSELAENGFIKSLSEILDLEFEHMEESDSLSKYLQEHFGEVYNTKTAKEILIQRIQARKNGRLCRSRNALNNALIEKGYPYQIINYEINTHINGKATHQHVWLLANRAINYNA